MTERELQKQRKQRLLKNTISSFVYQISAIVFGFILPHILIEAYGSDVNGLVNSVKQFLSMITFLELGVGAVVQSSLYKPLAEHDDVTASQIYKSAGKFFRVLGTILLAYVIVLVFIYPKFVKENFSPLYSAILIIAMSISSFSQYYFGLVNQLLVTADQKGYIQYTAQALTLLLSTISSYVLVKNGFSIHVVMFTTSFIYLLRPIFLRLYINKHYNIDRKITYTEEPIKQKWNGIAQHVAAVVLDNTDIVVLTVMSSLANVSVYYVYNLVVFGIKTLFMTLTNGIQSLLGEIWARNNVEELRKTFDWTEWVINTGTTLVFGCTSILLVPFIKVYTNGVNDANYIVPVFASFITLANAMHCLRLPYHIMIKATGYYKQTQRSYTIAAIINVIISVVAVHKLGLVGVAVGTLIAMLYQTVWMAVYNSKHFIYWPFKHFVKHIIVDGLTVVIGVLLTCRIHLSNISYLSWAVMALEVFVIWCIVVCVVNLIFYPDKIKSIFKTKLIRK